MFYPWFQWEPLWGVRLAASWFQANGATLSERWHGVASKFHLSFVCSLLFIPVQRMSWSVVGSYCWDENRDESFFYSAKVVTVVDQLKNVNLFLSGDAGTVQIFPHPRGKHTSGYHTVRMWLVLCKTSPKAQPPFVGLNDWETRFRRQRGWWQQVTTSCQWVPFYCKSVKGSFGLFNKVLSDRLITETEEGVNVEVNNPGSYNTVCMELDMASLAVNTLIQVLFKNGPLFNVTALAESNSDLLFSNNQLRMLPSYVWFFFSPRTWMITKARAQWTLTWFLKHLWKTWCKVRAQQPCWRATTRRRCVLSHSGTATVWYFMTHPQLVYMRDIAMWRKCLAGAFWNMTLVFVAGLWRAWWLVGSEM